MRGSVLFKDTYREIGHSLNRFFSILAIVALGVGFFAGVKATSPDMKATADKYFKNTRLMDLHAQSTMGFDANDVKAIDAQDSFNNVMFSYSADALMNEKDSNVVVRIYSMPDGKDGKGRTLNKPVLVSGRLPENSGECVVEENNLEKPYSFKLGDTIRLEDDAGGTKLSDLLKENTYTVVGFVDSPLYISFERGNSLIGNGSVSCFIMVPPQDFSLSVYTDAYLTSAPLSKLSAFDKGYGTQVSALVKTLQSLGTARSDARYNQLRSDGQKSIDGAKAKLQDAQNQIAGADKQLGGAKAQLDASQAKINSGQAELSKNQAAYQNGLSQYNNGQNQLETAKNQAGVGGQSDAQLQAHIDDIHSQMSQLSPDDTAYKQLSQESDGLSQLLKSQKQLESQGATLKKSKTQLDAASASLSSSKTQLATAQKEYDTQAASAHPDLSGAQQSIADGEKQLAGIQKPVWYVQTRDDNPGYSDYSQNADRIAAVATVFPLFFLLVAGLVCLTTMTRMVEEQRTQIGTLKALGYSRFAITSKYFIYAALASLLGSALGVAVGIRLFPTVIYNAYTTMYTLPPVTITFQWIYAVGATLAAIACTVCVALFASFNELVSASAMLMRPRAPKPGKRIFLEHITPLWSRMGFISKVTARNLLRYKARFLMSVVGIAGCGALILAGLGLKNSIAEIVPKQFVEIYKYNVFMSLKEDVSGDAALKLTDSLAADTRIKSSLLDLQKTMDAHYGGKKLQIHLLVPEDASRLENYIDLRHRTDGAKVTLRDDGVVITEKAATMLGVRKGGYIVLKDGGKTARVQITDIVENYVYHYVYMSPVLYAQAFGSPPAFNSVLGIVSSTADTSEKQLATDWLKRDDMLAVTFTSNLVSNFQNTIKGLDIVVLVMIISAGCLAFVVLYNLTNINITERLREIATIKVLGFYNGEVSNYVYRENLVLTVIGVALGLVLGIFLHNFVVTKSEVDIVMFGRVITPLSYVLAAALTVLFALFVNFVMYFKLRDISMVESLKTVE